MLAPDVQEQTNTAQTLTPAVTVEGVSFTYPKVEKPALNNVAIALEPGQMLALLGPNGSGKTTLFKLLTGMIRLPVSQGSIDLFRHAPLSAAARTSLGVVFQSPSLDGQLTVRENLVCQARLYGMDKQAAQAKAEQWAQRLSIADKLDSPAGKLSGGQKRRVELAKALLHDPKLVLMDEPSTGLDPSARRMLWDQIDELRKDASAHGGLSIIVTTHLMDEAERCDAAVLMHEGSVVASGNPGTLRQRIGGQVVRVAPNSAQDADALRDEIETALGPWEQANKPTVAGGIVHFAIEGGPARVPEIDARWGQRIREIAVGHATLEDVFMQLTGSTLASHNTP